MKTIRFLSFPFFALSVMISCQSDSSTKNIDSINDSITIEQLDSSINNTAYKIPNPIDLFISIERYNIPYHSEILSDPNHHNLYLNNYSQGLNFGIYSADLAYATVFGNTQDAILYFYSARSLASELGIYQGFGNDIASRIDLNIRDIDSLLVIANDSYSESIIELEEQGLEKLLGLILAGGWIESTYIATQSAKKDGIKSPVIELIVDQHLLLENLLLYMKSTNGSKDISNAIAKFEELLEIYDNLNYNSTEVQITEDQLVKISNKVSEIRNYFVFEI